SERDSADLQLSCSDRARLCRYQCQRDDTGARLQTIVPDSSRRLRSHRILQRDRAADAASNVAVRLFLRATFRRYSLNALLVVWRLLSTPGKLRLGIHRRLL